MQSSSHKTTSAYVRWIPSSLHVKSFKRTIRTLQLDHSQKWWGFISWIVGFFMILVIPILRLIFVKPADDESDHQSHKVNVEHGHMVEVKGSYVWCKLVSPRDVQPLVENTPFVTHEEKVYLLPVLKDVGECLAIGSSVGVETRPKRSYTKRLWEPVGEKRLSKARQASELDPGVERLEMLLYYLHRSSNVGHGKETRSPDVDGMQVAIDAKVQMRSRCKSDVGFAEAARKGDNTRNAKARVKLSIKDRLPVKGGVTAICSDVRVVAKVVTYLVLDVRMKVAIATGWGFPQIP
eukprot:Gb_34435 [translate_table: standard]